MDFSNKNYCLIGREGQDAELPKRLKKYFKCKIHCHQYYYDDVYYTHCVSIDKHHWQNLINFLDDCYIHYKPIVKSLERVNYYRFRSYSDEYLQIQQKRRDIIYKMNKVEAQLKLDHLEMLNDMTKATDLDIAEIVINGYDGYAHRQQVITSNRYLIEQFRDMCFKCLKGRK